jgi:hypothetical protein
MLQLSMIQSNIIWFVHWFIWFFFLFFSKWPFFYLISLWSNAFKLCTKTMNWKTNYIKIILSILRVGVGGGGGGGGLWVRVILFSSPTPIPTPTLFMYFIWIWFNIERFWPIYCKDRTKIDWFDCAILFSLELNSATFSSYRSGPCEWQIAFESTYWYAGI